MDDDGCDDVRTGEFGGDGGDSDCGVGGESGEEDGLVVELE